MYGISQKAHPGMNIKGVTKEAARDIYKREYYDAIGADKLPPALRMAAFDTAVIAGPARARQFIAQSGGDPMKFMDLRSKFMHGLVASNPGKYGKYEKGWTNRNADLRKTVAGMMGEKGDTQVAGAESPQRAVPYDPSKPSLAYKPSEEKAPGLALATVKPESAPTGSVLNRINPKDPSGPLLPEAGVAPTQVAQAPATPTPAPRKGFSLADLNPVSSAQAGDRGVFPEEKPHTFGDVAARMRGAGAYQYAPGVSEQESPLTDFGAAARKGDMPGDVPYAVNMAGAPMGPWDNGSGFTEKAAPEQAAPAPEASPAPGVAAAQPASGQKYWGDWRDTAPWKDDPIGGAFDTLMGDTPQSSTPGKMTGVAAAAPTATPEKVAGNIAALNKVEADINSGLPSQFAGLHGDDRTDVVDTTDPNSLNDPNLKGSVDFADSGVDFGSLPEFSARGGVIRKHFDEGGEASDDSDPLSAIGQGFGELGQNIGSAAESLGQGFGSLFGGGEQPNETASAATAAQPEGQDFYTRWSENPLSQFLYHAGQAMSAHPNAHPLEAIAAGMPGAITAGRAGSERAEKEAKAAETRAFQEKLNMAGRGEEPEEAPAESEAPEAPAEGEEGAALPAAAPAPRQAAPVSGGVAPAPRQAPSSDAELDKAYSRLAALSNMPATGSQIRDKQAAVAAQSNYIKMLEHRAAGQQGKIGTIGRDEFGRPVTGWVSGPNAGQPFAPRQEGPGAPAKPSAGLKGDDFLETLDPSMAARVKSIASGREALPTSRAMEPLVRAVYQYDPSYNVERKKVFDEFSSTLPNRAGGQIMAGNTALKHLGEVSDAVQDLKKTEFFKGNVPLINRLQQAVQPSLPGGYKQLGTLEAAKDRFIEEATKFYRGTGGTESDIQRTIDNIGSAKTPEELNAVLEMESRLFAGKVDALKGHYKRVMGAGDIPAPDFEPVNEEGEGALKKIRKRAGVSEKEAEKTESKATTEGPAVGEERTNKYGKKARWTGSGWEPI
jgi:hypothetical protein